MSDLELPLHDPIDPAKAEQERAQEDGDLKWLMAASQGRRIARRFLERGGIWRASFTGEPLTSAFREGERNAALGFLNRLLEAAPEATARIITGQDGK